MRKRAACAKPRHPERKAQRRNDNANRRVRRRLKTEPAKRPARRWAASLWLLAPLVAVGICLFRAGAPGLPAVLSACAQAVSEAPEQLLDRAGAPSCSLLGAFALGVTCCHLPSRFSCCGWRPAGHRGLGRPWACRLRRASSRLTLARGRIKGSLLARAVHGIRLLPETPPFRVGELAPPARPLWAILERATRALAAWWRRPHDPG